MKANLITILNQRHHEFDALFSTGVHSRVWRIIRHPIKTLLRLLQTRLIRDTFFQVQTKTFFGYPMSILSYEYPLWFSGFLNGTEIGLQKYIIQNFHSGIFFDIGAHHGYYSLLADHLIDKKTGSIHAFEPTDIHYTFLKRNTKNRQNIHINKLAICAKSGERIFYENVKGKSTIEKEFLKDVPTSKPSEFKTIQVYCTTLDEYCAKNQIKPSFIKIDVEGAEYEVLKGGLSIIQSNNPVIALELWSKPYDNTNHVMAAELLIAQGYVAHTLDEQGELASITYENLVKLLSQEGNSNNFVFKKV